MVEIRVVVVVIVVSVVAIIVGAINLILKFSQNWVSNVIAEIYKLLLLFSVVIFVLFIGCYYC